MLPINSLFLVLKDCFTGVVLLFYHTDGPCFFVNIRGEINAGEPEILSFVFPNLVPTLPTVQLYNQQFGWRFGRAMLAATNVASSLYRAWSVDEERATKTWWAHFFLTPHPQIHFPFQSLMFSPKWCWLKWWHLTKLHTAPSGAMQHQTLVCKISTVPL